MEEFDIEVCERTMDHTFNGKPKFHAQIKGKPGFWACGVTIDDAIGNLIRYHQDTFHIYVEYLGKQSR